MGIKQLAVYCGLGALLLGSCKKDFDPNINYSEKLLSAKQITISAKSLHTCQYYDINVNNVTVATVEGKTIHYFGDTFELKTIDDKLLASEKEGKSFLQFSRSATFYDKNGNVVGYLGEEPMNDSLSWGYIFHFYDQNKNEIGSSQKIGKSVFNFHKLYDAAGNEDYDIEKKFTLGKATYVLTVEDSKSEISLVQAILLTCIENAIEEAHAKKEAKNKE